jgi:hypothetical protein
VGFSEEHLPVVFFTNVGKITGCWMLDAACLPQAGMLDPWVCVLNLLYFVIFKPAYEIM